LLPPIEQHLSTHPSSLNLFQSRLLQLLRPHPSLQPPQTFDEDTTISPALPLYHTLSHALLLLLAKTNPTPSAELAAVLASLTSTADPWTTPVAASQAHALLASPALHDPQILRSVLHDLKPLFTARTASASRITPSGRLALRETTDKRINIETPAWQLQLPSAVAILEWTLGALAVGDIEAVWGLLIPPVLTLLDSIVTGVKTRAVGMITLLLQRVEGTTLLQRTGIAGVFWDAVLPCLSYLPPLTPAPEAVPLLRAAHTCLLALARREKEMRKKARLLDAVVREGFLRGLAFAGENVVVVEVFVDQLGLVTEEMGMWAVRHLRNVVPALAEILASPFGDAYPPLMLAAAKTMVTLTRNCWVRMPDYVAEVLRGVTVCWRRIGQREAKDELVEVEKELRRIVAVLRAVVEKSEGGVERWKSLREGIEGVNRDFETLFMQAELVAE
jgi:hypothetical protein